MSGSRFYQKTTAAGLINAFCGKGLALVNLWLWNQLLLREQFGEFIFALTIIEILALIATAGLDQGLIFRLTQGGERRPRQLAGASMGLTIAIGLVIASGASMAGGFWIAALAAVIPVKAAAYVLGGWRRGNSQVPSAIFLEQSLPAVIKTAILGVSVLMSFGLRAVIVAEIVAPILAMIPFWFRDRLNPFAALQRRVSFGYSLPLMLTRLLQRALDRSDIIMLGILASSAMVADYAVAARLAILVMFAHEMLNAGFTVRAGKLFGSGKIKDAQDEYRRVQIAATMGALACATVLGGLGALILPIFGEFPKAYPILLILIFAQLSKICFGPSGVYLKMCGRSAAVASLASIVLGLNILFNWWFIPFWGANGAAAATVLSMLITNTLTAWLIWKTSKFPALNSPAAAVLLVSTAITLAGVPGNYPATHILIFYAFLSLIFFTRARRPILQLLDHRTK